MTYATSPMGGDHTAGNGLFLQTDHRDPAGKVELSRNLQITSAWVDTLGLCTFVRGVHAADPEVFPALVNGRFGTGTTQTLQELGKKVLAFELEFNRRAGLREVEPMPGFLRSEPLPPHGTVWDIADQEVENIWKDLTGS